MKTVWDTYFRVNPDRFVCVGVGRDGSSCCRGQDSGRGGADWGGRHHLGMLGLKERMTGDDNT